MSVEKYAVEDVILIWDNIHGTHTYVGPDADGLDLMEVRAVDENTKITTRLTFTKEEANLVAKAILKLTES